MDNPSPVIVLVRDLMFSSKISSSARANGVAIQMVRDPKALETLGGSRLIVDLNQENALDAAAAWKARTGGAVTGFISHVEGETIKRARGLGIDQVMARSQFVAQLDEILAQNGR